jgi:hypothetical protein
MCICAGKYEIKQRSLVFMALLFSCTIAYPQDHLIRSQFPPGNDSIQKIKPEVINKITNLITLFSKEAVMLMPSSIIPSRIQVKDWNSLFFDSLKVKASKNQLTKKLYNFVIVHPDTTFKKQFTETSDIGYSMYSGKIIRRIIIQRLNVFGVEINNPLSDKTSKIENLLNKTHVNTNEKIIRKNLLFSEGEKIIPLTLSDNERILRQLPFIDDARIIVLPVSDEEADIIVYTKDVYSLGVSYDYKALKKGTLSVFDKNILGLGHEFGLDIPFDNTLPHSPGFGVHYLSDNIAKSFINLNVFYLNGLGQRTYGFSLSRKLVSSTTKYAGGISIRMMYTSEDLDTLKVPAPLKYNLQDYWLSRSFMLNKEKVSRLIIGARYTNNNVFNHPLILPESFYNLQKYKLYLASVAFSMQKYTKTKLIYSYGRTEDIPYGALFNFTTGREFNEFKQRTYLGGEVSFSGLSKKLGYFYTYYGLSGYLIKDHTEQGELSLGMNYFSNLINLGRSRIRNFVYLHYTRGFGRYSNEYLKFINDNGFSGFLNDSTKGTQRLTVSLESVIFSPVYSYGFRFAFFAFSDFSFLSGTTERIGNGYSLSSIGVGIRIRNDNLVLNTLQIRIGYFPNPPSYSRISPVNVSGEQLLRPPNFEPGAPAIIPFK